MHNTNLLYAIMPENTNSTNLRHTFFYNQLCGNSIMWKVQAVIRFLVSTIPYDLLWEEENRNRSGKRSVCCMRI
jgi:hypothetical protein